MSISHQKFEENEVRVLIVDDDKNFAEGLSNFLEKFNISTIIENRITRAEKKLRRSTFDVVLLDVMMPEGSGFDFLPKIRRICDIPIIMLTALDEEDELVNGLNLGADDYITKPFSVNELVARVKAVLRRIRPMFVDEVLTYKGIVIDLVSHSASRDGETLHLGPTEFNLLAFFMENIGRVFSREQLLNHVWKNDAYVEPRTVDVHIRRLRKAINNDVKEDFIRTVRSAGYCFGS